MSINGQIESINILNIDRENSTISGNELIVNESINDESFIVSDADEELLILIQFRNQIDLQSIKIYSLKNTINNMDEDEKIDASQPKQINVYKIENLNINFNDLSNIKYDVKIDCNVKKLEKGQNIKLQKTTKNVIKFNKIKYLAIYIKTNQNNTENTFVNAIKLKGNVKIENNNNDMKSSIIEEKELEEKNFEYPVGCVSINECIH
eukprot:291700_1